MNQPQASPPSLTALQDLGEAVESESELALDPVIAQLQQAAHSDAPPLVRNACLTWSVLLELAAAQSAPLEDDALLFVMENTDALVAAIQGDELAAELLADAQHEAQQRWGDSLASLEADLHECPDDQAAVDSHDQDELNQWDDWDDWDELNELDELATSASEMEELEARLVAEAAEDAQGESAPAAAMDPARLQQALAEMAVQHDRSAPGASAKTVEAPAAAAASVQAAETARQLDPELLAAFLDDAENCLGGLEQASLQLEQSGASAGVLQQIGRELHTIKGAAGCVGLDSIAALAHHAEELLPTGDVAQLLACIDDVTRSVEAVRKSPGSASATTCETSPPRTTAPPPRDEPATPPPADEPPSPAATHDGVAGAVGESTQRIRTAQLDRLMDMLAELVTLRNRRHASVEQLGAIHADLNRSIEIFKRLTSKFTQSVDGLGSDDMPVYEATLGSLSEVAADFNHSLRDLRTIYEPLASDTEQISQFIGQFRHEVAALRRLPVAGLFHKLRRVAREAARAEDKEVQLRFVGENFGIEPAVQERLYEPLLHIIRNAVSHGVELPEQREALDKPRAGRVTLEATGSAHLVQLEIRDDGRGLDYEAIRRRAIDRKLLSPDHAPSREELAQLIFHPGFSTRESVSQLSGRGVGMDVVSDTLEKMRGWIDVSSTHGKGTTLRISLPLPSVIQHMMVFRSGGQLYGVPMQSLDFAGAQQSTMGATHSRSILTKKLGKPRANEAPPVDPDGKVEVLWVHSDARAGERAVHLDDDQELVKQTVGAVLSRAAPMVVDEIVGPEEAVVRPLPPLLRHHPLVCGLSLSGSGEMVQLLDPHSLALQLEQHRHHAAEQGPRETGSSAQPSPNSNSREDEAAVLVVDDSKTARLRIARPIRELGIEVCQACDGAQALEMVKERHFSAIFTDLEMPVMDGFELLYELQCRNTREPVIVASTLQHATHKQRTHALGAADHLGKPIDKEALVATLRRWAPTLSIRPLPDPARPSDAGASPAPASSALDSHSTIDSPIVPATDQERREEQIPTAD